MTEISTSFSDVILGPHSEQDVRIVAGIFKDLDGKELRTCDRLWFQGGATSQRKVSVTDEGLLFRVREAAMPSHARIAHQVFFHEQVKTYTQTTTFTLNEGFVSAAKTDGTKTTNDWLQLFELVMKDDDNVQSGVDFGLYRTNNPKEPLYWRLKTRNKSPNKTTYFAPLYGVPVVPNVPYTVTIETNLNESTVKLILTGAGSKISHTAYTPLHSNQDNAWIFAVNPLKIYCANEFIETAAENGDNLEVLFTDLRFSWNG